MKTNTIPVVFICDENYAMPTAVAISSIKLNRAASSYDIYVLSLGLSEDAKKRISSLNEEGFSVSIIDKELSEDEQRVVQNRERVTKAALLKFEIPDILSQYDKVLYLDSDVLVLKDLAELFSISLDDRFAAVVKDVITLSNDKKNLEYIGFKNEYYFNSGVLLLNTKKLREEGYPKKLLQYRLNEKNYFMDQDTFNMVFGENVIYISPYNNLLNCFFDWFSIEELSDFYNEDFEASKEASFLSATVLHLGDKKKPWNDDMGFLSALYGLYYYQSPFSDSEMFFSDLQRKEIKKLKAKLSNIKNSKSYKLGRAIAYIPGKLKTKN